MDTFDTSTLSIEPYEGDHSPSGRDWEPCILCERPVVVDRKHHRVTAVDFGLTLVGNMTESEEAEVENRDDYHGTHAIGPGCRRKLPRGFAVLVKP